MTTVKLRGSVAGLALLILGLAAAVHGQPGNSSTTAAEKAVLQRLAEIQDAATALDPERIYDFVLENNKGSLVQNGKFYLTREEALQSTKQGFQGLSKVEYRFDQQHVSLLAPTVALATGEGVSSATTDDGRNFSTRFAQSVVLILSDGQWKVFHAHRSFSPVAARAVTKP